MFKLKIKEIFTYIFTVLTYTILISTYTLKILYNIPYNLDQNFEKLYFETDLDEKYQNAELKVFYELSQNSTSKIKIELLDAGNKLIEFWWNNMFEGKNSLSSKFINITIRERC